MLVITRDGENLGVISKEQALREAKDRELDLVVIAENSQPPVAKILDFKKFLYEENKKLSAAKSRAKKSELKIFEIGLYISKGDLDKKVGRSKEFLQDGDRVKFSIKMKGRQNLFPEVALDKLKIIEKELEGIGKKESEPKRQGNGFWVVYVSAK